MGPAGYNVPVVEAKPGSGSAGPWPLDGEITDPETMA